MQISRERFIDQFSCSILVHVLGVWPRSTRRFPEHIPRTIYDTLVMCAGKIPISPAEFGVIIEPAIRELHRTTPFRKRPDHDDLTGKVYDALDAARIEVTIGPPVRSHGSSNGARAGTGYLDLKR